MEEARGKAYDLLQPLLDSPPIGALLKDHLLIGIVLSKGIHWNQVRSEDTQRW